MDLQHLQNFLTIVEQKSISNAASLIRIAQPALSRQLRALEAEVGSPLLVRHRWGVSPTPAGEVLVAHAREILQRVQAARDEVSVVTRTPTGTLSVGVSASIASIVLPPLALAARSAMPQVKLKLVEANSVSLQQRLLARELDLAMIHVRGPTPSLETRPLLSEPLVAVGTAGVFDSEAPVSMKQLLAHDLMVTSSSGRLRLLYEEAVAKASATPTTFLEVDSFPALIELLAEGAGVTLLPYSTIHAGVRAGRLSWAPIAPKLFTRRLFMARPQDRIETPAWRMMAQLLRAIIEERRDTYRWSVAPPARW
jgi:LysR family nitrogen assimilation transcriptional regulator